MKSVLDSRQLLAARVLANTGSFTLAGQQLSLTQSAVSHAIKALEEEVECRLFTRTGKGVKVTAAGKHFLEYTDKILAQMETARTLVAPRTTRGKERLRLGVGLRAREYIMPIVLPLFQREYPNKLVTIEPGDYGRNLELLKSGLLDLVFAVKPIGRPEFGYVHLYEDELRFIVGAGHPWARSGRASREDLAGNTLMLSARNNNTPELLAEHFRMEKITPRHGVELPDHESIKALLLTNLAVGVLSPLLVAKELDEGSLVSVPLGSRPLVRQWGVAFLRQSALAPMEQRFIELCRLAVPGILSRMQGQPVHSREKKEAAVAATSAEPYLKLGCVALLLTSLGNFLSDSIACENLAFTLGVVWQT
jgi:DNA-binding transcriptional LysR family regulator